MSYKIVTVPLDEATGDTPREIYERNKSFDFVSVLELPADASLELVVGEGADPVPVDEGDALREDPCHPVRTGLFAKFPAQAGVVAKLYVGLGSSAGRGV